MSLNQLFHDHGVARINAHHADSASARDRNAAEALRIEATIVRKQAGQVAPATARDDHFEIFRADEVRMTSTQFSGGDWHWRLMSAVGAILVEGDGYRSEQECANAVALLQDRAFSASAPAISQKIAPVLE